jgi:MFS family permease
MPRHSAASLPFAMILQFLVTVSNTAWATGSNRYFYNTAVPPDKRTGYMAVWYAWTAIVGGSGPLIAGWLLQALSNLHGQFMGFTIDSYTPLFVLNAAFLVAGMLLAARVDDQEAVPMRQTLGQVLGLQPGGLRYPHHFRLKSDRQPDQSRSSDTNTRH